MALDIQDQQLPDDILNNAVLLFPMFYDPDPHHPPQQWTGQFVPENLIVLDGSWKQTSRMLKKIQDSLHTSIGLFEPLNPPLPSIRQPYFEGGMCTMEATISALKQFVLTEKRLNN